MRRDLILQFLHNKSVSVTAIELESEFSISNRTLRNELRELNEIGINCGFCIEKRRGEGYRLVGTDEAKLSKYIDEIKIDLAPDLPKVRVNNIIVQLLQVNDYVTIDLLAEQLMVSRSTVLADISEVEKKISIFNLHVFSKPHYGIRLTGNEINFRKALTFFKNQKEVGLIKNVNFQKFEEEFPKDLIKGILRDEVREKNINLSYFAFENIISHIEVLAYRITQKNFILPNSEEKLNVELIKPIFISVGQNICTVLSKKYNVTLPENEIIYLAAHLSGKASADDIGLEEKKELRQKIHTVLVEIDNIFYTRFAEDSNLLDALVMHMYPLLKRLYFNLTLSNPLIDDVYSRYSDVFMVAITFSQKIKEIWGFELSNDEMGYLTLHFATHMESEKQKSLRSFGHVLVIYGSGMGQASLQKMKLESVFSEAVIELISYEELERISIEEYDLVVSSLSLENELPETLFTKIAPIMTERDLQKIREKLAKPTKKPLNETVNLITTFRPELFHVEEGKDYIQLLQEKSQEVVDYGLASEEYPALVIERENIVSTIFQDSIAGPHSLRMVATQNSISVIILKSPITHNGKVVQLIFLINLAAGGLYLHKELSRLITYLIDNPEHKRKILKIDNFNDFQYEISKILLS